jgi:putative peptidoglycan lipid II flippase
MKTEHAQISRRVGVVGFYTLLSRVTGLLRDSVLAWAFGATSMADAFYVAFRVPNLLRRLVGEGALTIAFVPVYTEYLKKSREDGRRAASVIFTYLTIFLIVISILGIVFAPYVVKCIAWGFSADPQKFDMTVLLTKIMFPYILLISLVALAMGILNSLKRFAAPAAAQIFLNLSIVIGAVAFTHLFSLPVIGVAISVLIGGVLQLATQIPSLRKEGMVPGINLNYRHGSLKGLLLLMIPSAFGAAVYQVNVMVVTLLASFLPGGSVSYLWYADRVSEFPLGIFAIAVATAALPTLSDHAAEKDYEALKDTLNYSLRLTFLITIPSMVGLYMMSDLIVGVLFERGQFNMMTTAATAAALAIFAIKIPFVSGVRNIVPAFFALRDAKTPVYVASLAVVVNAAVALLLMHKYLHVGLSFALVISSAVNFIVLVMLIRRKIGPIGVRRLGRSVFKTSAASAVMATVVFLAQKAIGAEGYHSLWARAGALAGIMILGTATFVVVTKFLNPEDFGSLMHMVRLKRGSGSLTA